jgi:hypothetical protein
LLFAFLVGLGVFAVVVLGATATAPAGRVATAAAAPGSPAVEGPFVAENLAVYLLRGPDTLDLDHVVTLDEALERKLAVVRETGDVNELVVENTSDVEVFVEAGDIVKGGQQDRVLTTDLMLPPHSGPTKVAVFCVESGRWSPRAEESPAHFASSKMSLPSPRLKRAANSKGNQAEVWEEVRKLQQDLSKAAAKPVAAAASPTSLQLTLEGDAIDDAIAPYLDALGEVTANKSDVLGFAFAINGALSSADLYGASGLADKRWPTLLRAAAVEAMRQRPDLATEAQAPPTVQVVASTLSRLEALPSTLRESRQDLDVRVAADSVFEVIENRKASDGKLLHKTLLAIEE